MSSQFLSGLLLAAPYADEPIKLAVEGQLVSKPYVDMTLAVMRSFGVAVDASDLSHFVVPQCHYHAVVDYAIEPDASAASYLFAAAAITGGEVTVYGLAPRQLTRRHAFLRLP